MGTRRNVPSLRHAVILSIYLSSAPPVRSFSPLPSRAAVDDISVATQLRPPVQFPSLGTKRTASREVRLNLTSAPSVPAAVASAATGSSLSWWYMSLLALQFGCQPILTKKFTPKTITRSTVVLCQEVVKLLAAATFLYTSGQWTSSLTACHWTSKSWAMVAGIPAALYVVQNYCALMAYQNLPPVTFNVLNQTKTLSAALCCWLLLNKRQSALQIVSLFLLLLSALVIEKVVPLQRTTAPAATTTTTRTNSTLSSSNSSGKDAVEMIAPTTTATPTATIHDLHQHDRRTELISGVLPVLMASFLSGLAGALSQKSLQTFNRNSYLFTMELSAASLLFLLVSLVLQSPDAKLISKKGFFHGWTSTTWIPIVTNALGGVVVGLVTKYAGSVRKGFALIFGLLLSGILQSTIAQSQGNDDDATPERVTTEQVVGGILAAISLWMYSTFPI